MADVGFISSSLDSYPSSIEQNFQFSLDFFTNNHILGCLLIVLNTLLSNSAGIGGGPITVSILLYLFQLNSTDALALTQISIFGGSVIATLIKLGFNHPTKVNWPLIDFKLCALVCPLLMLGASHGALFTKVFPSYMILICLAVLVWVVTALALVKGVKMYREETERRKGYKRLTVEGVFDRSEPDSFGSAYLALIVAVLCLFCYSFVKKYLVTGEMFSDCFWEYFLISGVYHLVTVAFTIWYARTLLIDVQGPFKNSTSIYSTKSNIIKITIFSYLVGLISGTLGVGGGLLLNPLFVILGLNVEVSTACCNLIVLSSSISSSLQFVLMGVIGVFDGILMFLLSLIGSSIGVFYFKKAVEQHNRVSIIVFLLTLVLAVVGILVPVEIVRTIQDMLNQGKFNFRLHSIC